MAVLFLRIGDFWVNFENFSWTPYVNLQKSLLLEIFLLFD